MKRNISIDLYNVALRVYSAQPTEKNMRVSTMQMTGTMQYNMMSTTNQMNKTLIELSTGKSVNKPSDDVLASTQILGLEDDTAQLKSYESNINAAENTLGMAESMLTDINDSLNRTRDLVLAIGGTPLPGDEPEEPEEPSEPEGGTDPVDETDPSEPVSSEDIAAYCKEIEMMIESLADIGNSKSASGEYIFGGTAGDEKVITYDEETGLYSVGGGDSVREVQISDSQTVEMGVKAGDIFGSGEDNILNDLLEFTEIVTDPNTTQDEFDAAIEDALNTIDDTQAQVNQSLTWIGASMNKLDMAADTNSEQQMYNDSMQSGLEDTDFAEATMEFTMLQTQLQASQQAFAMINSTSLFDYV
ncbi:hypothetical protein ACH42_14980 [Endozoicomonas sp. (ex Bugula neritina AB1)]|nr:hypothetical protein ACH42_14980 [Endozoicomonas sp. (ex Bugula neritina AB1)]